MQTWVLLLTECIKKKRKNLIGFQQATFVSIVGVTHRFLSIDRGGTRINLELLWFSGNRILSYRGHLFGPYQLAVDNQGVHIRPRSVARKTCSEGTFAR